MKYELAEEILQGTMTHWDALRMTEENKDIQIISEIKYDDYQQYTHGMRYIESLALWMRQFDTPEQKECAYDLIKNKLIFVSAEEMRQLVSYVFPLKIKNYLLDQTKRLCREEAINDIEERKKIYRYYRRCSLFLGLSDGSHMDYFRRQNPDLSNEQVFVHYDISKHKADDMIQDLKKDMDSSLSERYQELTGDTFHTYFLMDDFTGSGKSFIRKDDKGWHGKVNTFYDQLKDVGYDVKSAEIHLILYIATEKALEYIDGQLKEYSQEHGYKEITIDAVQKVSSLKWDENEKLAVLLEQNYKKFYEKYKKSYDDKHFQIGEGKTPFYGFGDGSLALILYHNTPNNSLPILWYSWEDQEDALFVRVTRHKELG